MILIDIRNIKTDYKFTITRMKENTFLIIKKIKMSLISGISSLLNTKIKLFNPYF